MAQTGLFEKSKGKLFEKDVDRGLKLLETLTEEKRTREYKASRTSKAESEAFEAKQKCVKLLR